MTIDKLWMPKFDPSSSRDQGIIHSLMAHLEYAKSRVPNDLVGIFLQGSQNYGLDASQSDVDTWLVVLPTIDETIFSHPGRSETLVLPNGEHCCVKDVRLMFQMFKKQNINALEVLFTPWKIMNPAYMDLLVPVFHNREQIARLDNYRFLDGSYGTMRNRRRILINKDGREHTGGSCGGYDGKCLYHIDRAFEFTERFLVNGESFESSLVSKRRDLLLAAKAQRYTLDCAIATADTLMDEMKKLHDQYKEAHPHVVNASIKTFLDDACRNLLMAYLRNNHKFKEQTTYD